jgi:hypothetical protein
MMVRLTRDRMVEMGEGRGRGRPLLGEEGDELVLGWLQSAQIVLSKPRWHWSITIVSTFTDIEIWEQTQDCELLR